MFGNKLIPTRLAIGVALYGSAGVAFDDRSLACIWRFSALGLLLSLVVIFGSAPLAFGISLMLAGSLLVIVAIGLGFAAAGSAAGEPSEPSDWSSPWQ
jgi:hypothetical protein